MQAHERRTGALGHDFHRAQMACVAAVDLRGGRGCRCSQSAAEVYHDWPGGGARQGKELNERRGASVCTRLVAGGWRNKKEAKADGSCKQQEAGGVELQGA